MRCGIRGKGYPGLVLVLWWIPMVLTVFQSCRLAPGSICPDGFHAGATWDLMFSASTEPARMPWVAVLYFPNSSTNEPAGWAVHPIAFWTRVPSLSSEILYSIVFHPLMKWLTKIYFRVFPFLISRHSIRFLKNFCLFSIRIFNFSFISSNLVYIKH